jgi:hypothetical protein
MILPTIEIILCSSIHNNTTTISLPEKACLIVYSKVKKMQTNIFVIYSICIRLQLSLSPYMPNSWLFVMHFLCPDQHRASQKPADPFPISYINCVCFDLFWSVPGSKCGRFFILLFESEVDQMARSIYFFDNIWYIDNLHRENGKKDSKKQDSKTIYRVCADRVAFSSSSLVVRSL